MSSEIDELKELVRRTNALAEDTNRMVHKMRRSQRWHTVFQVIWWLTIVGITGAVYYYYLAPYLQGILELYGQTGDLRQQAADYFRNFRGQ